MLDINLIRDKKKEVSKALLKRLDKKDLDLDKIIKLDDERRKLLQQTEELKSQRNKSSKTKPDASTIKLMKKLGDDIKSLDIKLSKIEEDPSLFKVKEGDGLAFFTLKETKDLAMVPKIDEKTLVIVEKFLSNL